MEYTYKTYGTAKTFKTEGDMYEWLTGHRSIPIDEADKKRDKEKKESGDEK